MIRSRWWPLAAGLLFLALIFAPNFANIYVDSLWFGSLGYAQVFWYGFWIKFGLFAGFTVVTFALLRGGFRALERAFSPYKLGGVVTRFDDRPVQLDPERYARPLGAWVAGVWAFLVGLAMSTRWELFLLFFSGGNGEGKDPIFGKPIGFYMFRWPVYQVVASWLTGITQWVLLASLVYGALVFVSHMQETQKAAAKRTAAVVCSFALGAVLLVYAWRFSLARFSQMWRDHDIFSGVGYTQAHVLLPGLSLVAVTLVLAAGCAIANAFVWRRPLLVAAALAVPLVVYLGVGIATGYVDNFVVKPNELERQSPYIKYNIEGTRSAFNLDTVEARNFPTASGIEAFELKGTKNRAALDNIRLWDWKALQASLRQVQALRSYYDFPDVDVDRYVIDGKKRQVMIAAREMDIDRLPTASRNWVNERLVYTHGYGVTMNTADGFTPEGRPNFLLSNMPVKSTAPGVKLTRPEIYFGQTTDTPVYVKTKQKEFDFPQGDANAYSTYEGTGGIALGGTLRRTVLSWALGDLSKVPFSSDMTAESRVLLYRNIGERAQRIAPFLTYDNDPYIVIGDDGHLYWMLDAYTTSIYHPYSRHYVSGGQWTNYLRNSVKVVIDAYNGTTDFYAFDAKDPVLGAYRTAFPGLFKDAAKMPAGLLAHVRYPEQLFRTQADVYGLYHMQDVPSFFGREDVWSIAGEGDAPTPAMQVPPGMMPPQPAGIEATTSQPLDPYFVIMPLPGEKEGSEFVQILPFTPSRSKNMIGWMAGRSDDPHYGSLLTYKFPKSQLVDGPEQIKARINQDPVLSERFTVWNQQGSTVLRGNMLVIPLGKSLLYVEPIFLQANQSPTPELRLVVLATQERIVYGTTLREALTKLLGSEMAVPREGQHAETAAVQPAPAPPGGITPLEAPGPRQDLIDRAAQDLEAYQRLTAQGKYSEAGQRLESVRRTLEQLRGQKP